MTKEPIEVLDDLADQVADRIDEFLRERGARTERERHSDTDVRVLATVD